MFHLFSCFSLLFRFLSQNMVCWFSCFVCIVILKLFWRSNRIISGLQHVQSNTQSSTILYLKWQVIVNSHRYQYYINIGLFHLESHYVCQFFMLFFSIFHTVLFHRSFGKFTYQDDSSYIIGTIGYEDVDCDYIGGMFFFLFTFKIPEYITSQCSC